MFVPAALSLSEAAELVRDQPYSRYPVSGEGFDDLRGFVHIRDEYDPLVEEPDDGTVSAGLTIEEFAEQTGLELTDGPYETVAGFVLAHLGRLAVVGDEVTVGERTIRVHTVQGRRIVSVSVHP